MNHNENLDIVSNIGKNIRCARKKANLSQKELGKKLGVSGSLVGQYETGVRNPKISTIEKISIALNVSPVDLLTDNNRIASIYEFLALNDDYSVEKSFYLSGKSDSDLTYLITNYQHLLEHLLLHKEELPEWAIKNIENTILTDDDLNNAFSELTMLSSSAMKGIQINDKFLYLDDNDKKLVTDLINRLYKSKQGENNGDNKETR